MTPEHLEAAIQAVVPILEEMKRADAAWRDESRELRLAWLLGHPAGPFRRLTVEQLVILAECGNPDADRHLRRVTAGVIEDGGSLPPEVRRFVVNVLLCKAPMRRKRRRDRGANIMRNTYIIGAILEATRYGFKPTRNIATAERNGAESACSIVVYALDQIGLKVTEAMVNDVWKHRPFVGEVPPPIFPST